MKKYIHKVFLFLLPLIVIGVLMELLLRNIPNDYSYKKSYLDKNSNKIENLFLGSSHTFYGINPVFISGNSFNASHISQSINWDYEIIKKYKGRWGHLKFIIIPIDYFTLLSRVSTGVEFWRVKNYNIYYNIHSSYRLSDNSELLSIGLKLNIKRIYSYYFKHISSISCSTLGFGVAFQNSYDLVKTGIIAAERHTKTDYSYFKKNLTVLNEIIAFASKKNVQVLFYTSPAYHTYVSNLSKKQLNLTLETIEELVNNNNNCSYYNLLEDSSFVASDFRDADHLNPKGAKKLSIKIDSLISLGARAYNK